MSNDEFIGSGDVGLTTRERTAFDIGRRGSLDDAVARLDALGNAHPFRTEDIVDLATRHRGARGLRQLAVALDLHDRGAESARETWLRLLLIREGFPRPRTQIPVLGPNGFPRRYLDIGWEDLMVAVEYDGEHHRTDRPTYVKGIIRAEYLASVGWIEVRAVAGNRRPEIVQRVCDARESRLR